MQACIFLNDSMIVASYSKPHRTQTIKLSAASLIRNCFIEIIPLTIREMLLIQKTAEF